jgi:hypothetical protein
MGTTLLYGGNNKAHFTIAIDQEHHERAKEADFIYGSTSFL